MKLKKCRGYFFLYVDRFLVLVPEFTNLIRLFLDVILHRCTINDNHMMYVSWDIERNGQNFLSFWIVFCPFTPITTRKIKMLKNWKKTPGDIIILHKCTKNHDHMIYCSWDMARKVLFFILGYFLHFYLPNSPKNQNLKKNEKNGWRYHHFRIVYQKL